MNSGMNTQVLKSQLEAILAGHASWETRDFLSERIFCKGRKILQATEQQFAEKVKKFGGLLVSPLFGQPLKEPLCDRCWLWEKCELKLYQRLNCPASPYDGEVIEAEPHLLAAAAISWLAECSAGAVDISNNNSSAMVALAKPLAEHSSPYPRLQSLTVELFNRLASKAIERQNRCAQRKAMKAIQAAFQSSLKEMEVQLAGELTRAKEEAAACLLRTEQTMVAMQENHNNEVAAIAGEMERKRAESLQLMAELEACDATCFYQQCEIDIRERGLASLGEELAEYESVKQGRERSFAAVVVDLRQQQQGEQARLRQELQASEARLQHEVAAQVETFRREKTSLEVTLQAQRRQIEQTTAALQESERALAGESQKISQVQERRRQVAGAIIKEAEQIAVDGQQLVQLANLTGNLIQQRNQAEAVMQAINKRIVEITSLSQVSNFAALKAKVQELNMAKSGYRQELALVRTAYNGEVARKMKIEAERKVQEKKAAEKAEKARKRRARIRAEEAEAQKPKKKKKKKKKFMGIF